MSDYITLNVNDLQPFTTCNIYFQLLMALPSLLEMCPPEMQVTHKSRQIIFDVSWFSLCCRSSIWTNVYHVEIILIVVDISTNKPYFDCGDKMQWLTCYISTCAISVIFIHLLFRTWLMCMQISVCFIYLLMLFTLKCPLRFMDLLFKLSFYLFLSDVAFIDFAGKCII